MKNISSKKFFLCISTILTCLTGCNPYKNMIKKKVIIKKQSLFNTIEQEKKEKIPIITIWIHGTRPSIRALKILHKLAQKPARILGIKKLPYFHSVPGLKHISEVDPQYRLRRHMEILTINNPDTYPREHAYIFGWSGKLSFTEREKEARNLYHALQNISIKYKNTYNTQPIIRIIAHSHGGNVALNLAKIHKQENAFALYVDELILLGCPVQKETAYYTADPIFKKIYSLYSHSDIIQIIDPQGLYSRGRPFFSKRRFPFHEKMKQVYTTFNGRPMLHLSFIIDKFIKNLPAIIQKINNWYETKPIQKYEIRKLRIFIK